MLKNWIWKPNKVKKAIGIFLPFQRRTRMNARRWPILRRDLLVGAAAAFLTLLLVAPAAWASHRSQRAEIESTARQLADATQLAEEQSDEIKRLKELADRNLVEQAAEMLGGGDKTEAEVRRVSTGAVSPEVPEGALLLIDKKAKRYAPGDIIVYQAEKKHYLGRVLALDKIARRLTVGRNNEVDREISLDDLEGKGVLNTR
jgi:hypothetical protein